MEVRTYLRDTAQKLFMDDVNVRRHATLLVLDSVEAGRTVPLSEPWPILVSRGGLYRNFSASTD